MDVLNMKTEGFSGIIAKNDPRYIIVEKLHLI